MVYVDEIGNIWTFRYNNKVKKLVAVHWNNGEVDTFYDKIQ